MADATLFDFEFGFLHCFHAIYIKRTLCLLGVCVEPRLTTAQKAWPSINRSVLSGRHVPDRRSPCLRGRRGDLASPHVEICSKKYFNYVDDGWAPSLRSAATKNVMQTWLRYIVKQFFLTKYLTYKKQGNLKFSGTWNHRVIQYLVKYIYKHQTPIITVPIQ